MILQALSSYYDRLLKDPDEDVPEPGFSKEKIDFEILLGRDGALKEINNIQIQPPKGEKKLSRLISVPEKAKGRTSTAIVPNFLWDRVDYALGADLKGKPERAHQLFSAFQEKAHEVGDNVQDTGMQAVLRFLDTWSPDKFAELPNSKAIFETTNPTVVFRLDGETRYVHDSPEVRVAWARYRKGAESKDHAVCLITGEHGPVTRLHPSLSGIRGANTTGAFLVSFNADAYFSYGKTYNQNAPVGERAAFAYTTALNHMLARSSSQKVQLGGTAEAARQASYGDKTPPSRRTLMVGDATTLFWTKEPTQAESDFTAFFDAPEQSDEAHDKDLLQRLEKLVNAVRDGKEPPLWGDEPKTPFYLLGLAPNAARLSVRFWHVSSVAEMAGRLGQHFVDLEIEKACPKNPSFPSLWQLLIEVAPLRKTENIPPTLGGELMRAVITGSAYPQSLLTRVLGRIRAEQNVSYLKAALIKACLNRLSRLANEKEDVTVALDPTCKNIGYLLGRLFAVLEKAQQDALPGINATIKDRFFGAASATPRAVFPRLIRLAQHHISKAEYGHVADRLLAKVSEKIDACGFGFPAHLSLESQGMFALGYYHQRNDNYRKNEDKLDPIKEN